MDHGYHPTYDSSDMAGLPIRSAYALKAPSLLSCLSHHTGVWVGINAAMFSVVNAVLLTAAVARRSIKIGRHLENAVETKTDQNLTRSQTFRIYKLENYGV